MKEDLESIAGFVLRLQAKEQTGERLGLRERLYLKAVKRVKRRGEEK